MDTTTLTFEQLQAEVARLTNLNNWTTGVLKRAHDDRDSRQSKIDNVVQYLRDNRDDLGDHAQEIADLLDASIKYVYNLSVTVTFTTPIESDDELTEDYIERNISPELNIDIEGAEGAEYTVDSVDLDLE